jgi:RIO kinase 2
VEPCQWRQMLTLPSAKVEQGSRNHEVVPTPLITSISGVASRTGIHRQISSLAKLNLIAKVKNARYDGYRLTYGGLDYLALRAHLKSSSIYSVGSRIGVGKESDIMVVAAPTGEKLVLKIHRLGRISFRSVKTNRDYLRNRSSGSWMYMSRLAAMKENAFLQALYDAGFPVPTPMAYNRHTVLMSLVDAYPLRQISEVPDPARLYAQLIELILRFARWGLIHGDFNEFNILIEEHQKKPKEAAEDETSKPETAKEDSSTAQSQSQDTQPAITLRPVVIDFPQTLSVSHPDAEFYFNRDVQCIKRFFERKYHFVSDEPGPFFADAVQEAGRGHGVRRLDVEVEASGFSRKMAKELERYMTEVGAEGVAKEKTDTEELDENHDQEADDSGESDGSETEDVIPDQDLESVANGMTVLDIQDTSESQVDHDDVISMAGSVRDSSRLKTAKASKGWAI